MVALSDPQWLQGAFSTLVGLFDRVGLRKNVRKTVGMVFRPCQAEGTQLEAAYWRQMTGEGPSYRSFIRDRCSTGSAGRRWQLYRWKGTWRHNMSEWQRKDGVGKPRIQGKNHRCTAWPSWPRESRKDAWLRDARDEWRWGRRCGSILFTGMSGTPLSFLKRETSPTHGDPNSTCWSPGVRWMEGNFPLHSAPGGRSGR